MTASTIYLASNRYSMCCNSTFAWNLIILRCHSYISYKVSIRFFKESKRTYQLRFRCTGKYFYRLIHLRLASVNFITISISVFRPDQLVVSCKRRTVASISIGVLLASRLILSRRELEFSIFNWRGITAELQWNQQQ
jgi:hypothetical protein